MPVSEKDWRLPSKRDRFGLRTRRTHGPLLMRAIAARLEQIGGQRENPDARAYVEAVLAAPHWGLRVLAIRALGRWGGKANKAWLMERAGRPTSPVRPAAKAKRWQELETLEARAALRPLLTPKDSRWFLDALFADEAMRFYRLGHGMGVVPDAELIERLHIELRSPAPERRRTCLRILLLRPDLVEGRALVALLLSDRDDKVRHFAAVVERQLLQRA